MKPLESSGRHNIKVIINKQTKNTVALKPKLDSKISTVKKNCKLITLLIKRFKKALSFPNKTLFSQNSMGLRKRVTQ